MVVRSVFPCLLLFFLSIFIQSLSSFHSFNHLFCTVNHITGDWFDLDLRCTKYTLGMAGRLCVGDNTTPRVVGVVGYVGGDVQKKRVLDQK